VFVVLVRFYRTLEELEQEDGPWDVSTTQETSERRSELFSSKVILSPALVDLEKCNSQAEVGLPRL
jgi:hypothetical protein